MSATLQGAAYYMPLPPAEKMLLLALADHCNDDGVGAWPGNERLATKTSYSVRNVQRILGRLESAGLIARVAHASGGRGFAVEWALNMEVIYTTARANGWTEPPIDRVTPRSTTCSRHGRRSGARYDGGLA